MIKWKWQKCSFVELPVILMFGVWWVTARKEKSERRVRIAVGFIVFTYAQKPLRNVWIHLFSTIMGCIVGQLGSCRLSCQQVCRRKKRQPTAKAVINRKRHDSPSVYHVWHSNDRILIRFFFKDKLWKFYGFGFIHRLSLRQINFVRFFKCKYY